MQREVGGGIGMGNTCKPMADSFQCMTKSTTIKKKKNTYSSLNAFSIIGAAMCWALQALEWLWTAPKDKI